jgi:penicillin-binding protein 2
MPVFNQSRSTIIRLIFIGLFLIIILQLFNLQVLSSKYSELAKENALFPKRVYPTRGIIYDRKSRAILDNTILYDLMVIPAEVKNMDTMELCNLLQIDTSEFRSRILNCIFKNTKVRPSIFEDLLTPAMHAKLEENLWKFKGFYLQDRPVRTYPFNAAAHIMGYIGEVDSAILKRSRYYYQLGDYVGRSGLEQAYESILMGQRGIQYWIRDPQGRLINRYENGKFDTPAIAGRNLRTYIDIEVQQLAEKLLSHKIGAVVAIQPKTGGIIAMASSPDYNPNDLTGPDKQKNYANLVLDVSRPLFNRAIKGQYPAGSTYKPLGALIALDEGIINEKSGYDCHGLYLGCARPVKCTENWAGHAANLRLAIAHSCNSFFSNTFRLTVDNPALHSPRKGLTKWKEYATAFGLGHKTGIDLPSEDGGNIPDTAQYDKEYHGSWNSCTMVTLGIGQDKMTVTPLQIANSICIVANKGYFYTPHFVERIDGESAEDTTLNRYRRKHEVLTHISDETYETVISGMQDVVDQGTAQIAKIPGINICAKTGTAENKTVIDKRIVQMKDHSLFVCFAPRENPQIAVAVIVENAGFGATWAAPIGSLLVEKYLRDTLRAERLKEVDRIASTDLMPDFLGRLQTIADSTRGEDWLRITGDSSRLRKYLNKTYRPYVPPPTHKKKSPPQPQTQMPLGAILPDRKNLIKRINT